MNVASKLGREIWISGGKRTAFGPLGGAPKGFTATDLAVVASKAALEAGRVEAKDVDEVVFGNVQQTSADAIYLARHVGLQRRAGALAGAHAQPAVRLGLPGGGLGRAADPPRRGGDR